MAKYRHEAAEHRRILFGRGSGMDPTWRNFRQFLADMGPAPDADHLVTRVTPGDLTYAPGKCAWIHRDRQPALTQAANEPVPAKTFGLWASVGGQPVEYASLAKRLGVPFEAMAVALRSGQSPEELVQQAHVAESLVSGSAADASWLPPERERREAFLTAYRMWHMQVHPRYAAAATPAFLYLYSALPGMKKTRDALISLGLWNPPTEQGRQARSVHDLWRRYCDSMLRVEGARAEFSIYKQYSLTDELDELWARVHQAEERFRAGPRS
ncbi:hypothetical protein [Phenylobacterium montanum]|uniref:Uncharacterized protein n=1 Tax=Phenylobacterium montanum TaxID=2823693 RepID=A0A975G0I2_9CAUL|nr:hypothetical protein [Caulobacter sp. S6]QUD88536.1 hypothetical protein KCG34_01175 [Caulobacter sp. S6]